MPSLYLLAVLPPEDLSNEIHEIRLECSEKFSVHAALKPPVHITLYPPFNMELSFEKRRINLLHQATSHLQPFEQELENFKAFEHSRVVYIQALKNQGITDLHKDILSVFRHYPANPERNNTAFHPHITIAYRDVTPEIFPQIWKEYKSRKFKRKFLTDHFTLLRHDGKRWIPIENFKLNGTPQPELFS